MAYTVLRLPTTSSTSRLPEVPFPGSWGVPGDEAEPSAWRLSSTNANYLSKAQERSGLSDVTEKVNEFGEKRIRGGKHQNITEQKPSNVIPCNSLSFYPSVCWNKEELSPTTRLVSESKGLLGNRGHPVLAGQIAMAASHQADPLLCCENSYFVTRKVAIRSTLWGK